MACKQCKYYSAFEEPRDLSIAGVKYQGSFAYGMCYKQKPFGGNYQGHPVFIPEGSCKEFSRKKGIRQRDVIMDGQITLNLNRRVNDE